MIKAEFLTFAKNRVRVIKRFWHRRAAKKSLITSLEERRLNQNFKIKKMRVLLDTSLGVDRQFFIALAKELRIADENLSIFAFKRPKELVSLYFDFFDPADINFFGRFQGDLALMCEKEVDLQINYFNTKDLYMEWISTRAKNKLGVGFFGVDQRLNDIVFDMDPTDYNLFKAELVKYLTVLKKL